MSVGDGPRTGDETRELDGTWLAVFVGDLDRNRVVGAAPGEHFPPAEVDGFRLSSANEATHVATYRAAIEPEAAASRSVRLITCSGCADTWTALSAAHCGACHRLFASVALFDMHRSQDGDRGACIPPGEVQGRNGEQRLFFRDGMWRGPEMSDEERERLRAVAS